MVNVCSRLCYAISTEQMFSDNQNFLITLETIESFDVVRCERDRHEKQSHPARCYTQFPQQLCCGNTQLRGISDVLPRRHLRMTCTDSSIAPALIYNWHLWAARRKSPVRIYTRQSCSDSYRATDNFPSTTLDNCPRTLWCYLRQSTDVKHVGSTLLSVCCCKNGKKSGDGFGSDVADGNN